VIAALLALPQPADARRMGGGSSVGKQYSTPSPVQTPPSSQRPAQTQAQAAAPGMRTPQAGGASRWLGPLAGLAAGGLLASLFFGGAFEGFQIMDVLVIVALAFGVFMIVRMMRRRQAAGPMPAGAGAYGRIAAMDQGPRGPAPSALGTGSAAPVSASTDQVPAWFDAAGFVAGAKGHFVALQAAWDKGDFSDLQEYTTPQMLTELKGEYARLGGPQHTEVVRLQAEMVSVQRDGNQAVASILFSGLIREDPQAPAQEFREIWHVQHDWASAAGNWYIAGIQQA
jgi:predicted lipid-binding transport protein (Tim44 family)